MSAGRSTGLHGFGHGAAAADWSAGGDASRDLFGLGAAFVWGGCLCLALTVALVAVPSLRLPSFVPSVTVVNSTDHDLLVEVSDGDGGGWLELGSVAPNAGRSYEEVIDQGANWVFRLQRPGDSRAYAQFQVTREEFRGAGWSITVPLSLFDLRRTPKLDGSASS